MQQVHVQTFLVLEERWEAIIQQAVLSELQKAGLSNLSTGMKMQQPTSSRLETPYLSDQRRCEGKQRGPEMKNTAQNAPKGTDRLLV